MSENLMTPEFRVSYPNLFTAKLNDLNGKMEFSVVALFKKGENLDAMAKEATRVVQEKFGERLADKTLVDPKDPSKGTKGDAFKKRLRSPFRDQGERTSDGYESGAVFVNFKANQKPGVVDANVQTIIDPAQVYPGCHGRATVRAYAYDQKGNVGVAFGLQNFQKTRDGDSLSGRVKAENDFQPIAAAAGDATAAQGAAGLFTL